MPNMRMRKAHNEAMRSPRGIEIPVVRTLEALKEYARISQEIFGYPIGEDRVLGHSWLLMARGLSGLLDGPTDYRLDCGTLSHEIFEMIKKGHFDAEELLSVGFDATLANPRS